MPGFLQGIVKIWGIALWFCGISRADISETKFYFKLCFKIIFTLDLLRGVKNIFILVSKRRMYFKMSLACWKTSEGYTIAATL
jgi:hypothetical protein